MLTSLRIKNFKSLRDVTLDLGNFNVFVGANASGKSNVFDALRVLQGIGNGYSFSEILNGKPRGATNEQWAGIRGGNGQALFNNGNEDTIGIEVESRFKRHIRRINKPSIEKMENVSYLIEFLPDICKLRNESLFFERTDRIYDSRVKNDPRRNSNFRVRCFNGKPGKQPQVNNDASSTVLSQLVARTRDWEQPARLAAYGRCRAFLQHLADMQHLAPSPSVLAQYTQLPLVERMGEQGENFAGLVKSICDNSEVKEAYLQWLRHLRPDEVEDVGILGGAMSDVMFYIQEHGEKFPAPVLSDGTLKFAALAAAFFQPDMPGIITLEEPEDGIHPSRLRLLLELLREQSARTGTQVFITTHSPTLLDWLAPDDYQHTFFCKRDEDTKETAVRPISEIPRIDAITKETPLGELFTEGWLENAP